MSVGNEYLDTSYKFDTGMLVKPIRKASMLRQVLGSAIKTVLDPSDLQVTIETLTDDFNIGVDREPYETTRSTQSLIKDTYNVSVIQGEMSYGYDEIVRINNSKLPYNERVATMGTEIAEAEDAMFWAASTVGLKDGDHQAFIENGTAVSFDVDAYSTSIATATGLGAHLGTLGTNLGNLKQYPLIFAYNDKAFSTMAGIESGVGANDTTLQVFDRMLKLYGAPGSGLAHIPNLGCAVTVNSDNSMTVTVEADECVALMALSDKFFTGYFSPLDARLRPPNKVDGQYVKVLERALGRVHNSNAIMYDLDASP